MGMAVNDHSGSVTLAPNEKDCAQNGNNVILNQADLNSKHEIRNSKQSPMTKFQMFETDKALRNLNFGNSNLPALLSSPGLPRGQWIAIRLKKRNRQSLAKLLNRVKISIFDIWISSTPKVCRFRLCRIRVCLL
jgi:hypothetical protein